MFQVITFVLCLTIVSPTLYAKKLIATVAKVRGTVTVLPLGALKAFKVKVGTKLYEDSSILCHNKSFVQVKYLDGSTLNLGPKSKMVLVELERDTGVGVVSLLKGKLRAKIEKNRSGRRMTKNKFFVKTRTAALGVRGTKFETVYNPLNDATSLVTFEGKVAMTKVNDKIIEHQVKELATDEEKQLQQENVDKLKKRWKTHKVTSKDLDKILETNDTVVVKQGQFSGVTEGLKKTTLPVKINPVQFTVLYHNDEFSKVDKKVTKKLIKQAPQKAPVDGFFDKKTGDFAPRAGGFIDPETGLYVPPKQGSKLNKKLGVYEDKGIGTVDKTTGKYVPPKGLRLDAKKGFVLDKSALKKKDIDKTKLLVMKESLNNTIETDLLLKKKDDAPAIYALSYPELFAKNRFSFTVRPHETKWHINKLDPVGVPAQKITEEDTSEVVFRWDQQSSSTWQISTAFSIRSYDQYDQDFSNYYPTYEESVYGESIYGLEFAVNYLLSNSSLFRFRFLIDQDNFYGYYYSDTDTAFYLDRQTITLLKAMIGYKTRFFEFKRFFMDTSLDIGFSKPKEQGHFDLQVQWLSAFTLGANYWLGRNYTIHLGVWGRYQTGDVEGAVIESTISKVENGAEFNISYIY